MDTRRVNESVHKICNAITQSTKSYVMLRKEKQRINISDMGNIYVLTKGNVSAHSYNNGFLIATISAEEIIGLESIRDVRIINYIRCVTDAEMYVISINDACDLFTELGLWEAAFDVILRYMMVQSRREIKLNQPTSRSTVIEYIKHIWTFKPEQREKTSIYVYVMARTNISRSLIHKVITDLERKGLVLVRRGVLINCDM
ncbi:helix-turn-helix domain-containing protein [Enterobacter roggenkampii]|uniref:helix-turn-helix domain-containing protein n=1 Tax=Enterobacter roggenkampii TaxID=1812935 RepID=UPI002DB8854A|nr:helix-turn-helix domain-containing protein [Enterobacter roggenkampii]MEB5887499.1 helix-turn-helix domain-containing protein [Enterobacter roggenkampii]